MTFRAPMRARLLISASVMPSANQACSGSPERSSRGSTARDRIVEDGTVSPRSSSSLSCSSSSRRSSAVRNRRSGSFSRACAMIRSSWRGSSGRSSVTGTRIVAQDRGEKLGRGVAQERTAARRHLVQDHAEREQIGAMVDRLPLDLLRRHVGDRALEPALGGDRVGGIVSGCGRRSAPRATWPVRSRGPSAGRRHRP